MNKIKYSASAVFLLSFLFLFGATSDSFCDQLLFSDDFSDGNYDGWLVQIGEWYAGGQSFCVADCGS